MREASSSAGKKTLVARIRGGLIDWLGAVFLLLNFAIIYWIILKEIGNLPGN